MYMLMCEGSHMHVVYVNGFGGQRTSLAVACWLFSPLFVCLFILSLPLIRLEFTVVCAGWSAPAICLCLLSSLIVGFLLLPLHLGFKHGFWGSGDGGT